MEDTGKTGIKRDFWEFIQRNQSMVMLFTETRSDRFDKHERKSGIPFGACTD